MILHNMIIEDERAQGPEAQEYLFDGQQRRPQVFYRTQAVLQHIRSRQLHQVFDRSRMATLRSLIERHLWETRPQL